MHNHQEGQQAREASFNLAEIDSEEDFGVCPFHFQRPFQKTWSRWEIYCLLDALRVVLSHKSARSQNDVAWNHLHTWLNKGLTFTGYLLCLPIKCRAMSWKAFKVLCSQSFIRFTLSSSPHNILIIDIWTITVVLVVVWRLCAVARYFVGFSNHSI